MRFWPRSLLLALGMAALVTLFTNSARGAEPRANNAAGSERLKYLPKDYFFVGELDVRIIMQVMSLANVQQNPQMAQFKQAMQLFENFTGIDLEEDVNSVTLFAAGQAGDKAKGALLVAQGKIDNATVEKKLSGAPGISFTEKTYKNRKLLSSTDFAVSLPEKSTIVVGERAPRRRQQWSIFRGG